MAVPAPFNNTFCALFLMGNQSPVFLRQSIRPTAQSGQDGDAPGEKAPGPVPEETDSFAKGSEHNPSPIKGASISPLGDDPDKGQFHLTSEVTWWWENPIT